MLFRFILLLPAFLCSLSAYAASSLTNVELRDLFFGEVLYYAYQDNYFEALSRLDAELSQYYALDESTLDPLSLNLGQAEFSVGDIELQYRMNQRAEKAIRAVLGKGVDLATRNQAALALARMFYRKNDAVSALYALDYIRDDVEENSPDLLRGEEPENFSTEVAYLRALASIDTGQFSEAVKILQSLRNEKSLKGFVLYNLGIALIQDGKEAEGIAVFDELGQLDTNDNAILAIKDKANLKLAYRFLDNGNARQARTYFERIRLDGPFSDKALLGAGWAAVAQGRYDRALVPWSILHERGETNDSVQEVLMAVPYAYGKLKAYGNAANLYDYAMKVFAREIESLDDSIKSIRTGKLLTALLDERSEVDKNWVVNLRNLPDTPETRYLLELMASNDFQSSYKNYTDLAALHHHLDKWLDDLRVFEEMIDIRRAYQEPLLPVVEEKFKKIDARIKLRLEQRNSLAIKLKNMLIAPRPEYLATADERIAMERISVLEEYIKAHPRDVGEEFIQRVKRLRGVILWSIQSDYDQRLTDAYNHLIDLDELIKELNTRYQSFIRTRQAATQSYDGYSIPIRQFRTRLFDAQRKLKGVMAKQGRVLETMAINELDQRRKRLEEYQIKARFALAESYDRATKAQLDEEIEKQRKLHESRQTENVNQTVNQQEESQAENASQQVNDSEQATKEQNTVADEPAAVDEAATQDASEASSSNEDSSADR
ncbi:MAG: tetratricopeptide repeat protein [Gammaproteobacteria bacterium]|nr:tetratricopeptide repeat protein [Gammaproteobacteria bacterium]